MDAEDQKDIIKKVKEAGKGDEDVAPESDTNTPNDEEMPTDEPTDEPTDGEGIEEYHMFEHMDNLFVNPKKNNMFQPNSNDILDESGGCLDGYERVAGTEKGAKGSCKKINEKSEGLWANIHAKKERGEAPAKPGDEDYPDKKVWDKLTEEGEEMGKTNNYMFWQNLKSINDDAAEILGMDMHEVDALLSDGHNWAVEHVVSSKDDVEEVYHFLEYNMERKPEMMSENEDLTNYMFFSSLKTILHASSELGILNEETRIAISKKADKNGNIYNAEASLIAKNGEMKHVLLSAENIYLQEITYRFTVVHDITDRKLAEEEIKKARKLADNANFAKSEFLARMSHEIRTPMNSILGFAQLLNMGEISPAQKKSVNFIMGSGKHLLKLINEVLDISRIEAGRITLSPAPVQLSNLILEMLDIVQPIAEDRLLKTELAYSTANRLFVMADDHRLRQVLLNLINNAVKYNRKGGSIIIKTQLRQPGKLDNSVVRISISDTGLGINQEDILKLFIPFERIGADKTETEGTGLGLAVVKKLMEAMGGEVGVDSIPGQGSTFWIELPQTKATQAKDKITEETSTIEDAANIKSGTILYVEDNIPNAELVEEIINSYRPAIKIIICKHGKKAVEMANHSNPGLILLDLDLPDIHGSEVLANLKADINTRAIPVVIVSADAMPEKIEKLMQAGSKEYFTKPLDIVAFLKVVDMWIGKRN